MNKPRRRKKLPNPRKLLWKVFKSFQTVGSMPSWALPIETIAAWMFLASRPKDRKSSSDRSSDRSSSS
jgi:hypothetical protein